MRSLRAAIAGIIGFVFTAAFATVGSAGPAEQGSFPSSLRTQRQEDAT